MTTANAELPPSSSLALPIVISIPSSRPIAVEAPGRFVPVLLQVSHRAFTVALLAELATGYCAFAGHEFYLPLATAFGAATLGLCASVLSLSFTRQGQPQWPEAVGVGAVNAAVAVLGAVLMLAARAGVIQDAIRQDGASVRAEVQEFLTPPPVLPPQP